MNLNAFQKTIGFLTGRRLFLALGSAYADGTQAGRKADERHAFLAYIWEKETLALDRIFRTMEKLGWRIIQIDNYKTLTLPFKSNDPALSNAFRAALHGDVGIVIYSNDE